MMELTDMIKDRIKLVNDNIVPSIQADVPALQDAMRHYPVAGGKRLRPVMALVVSAAVGGNDEKTLPYALALEMTHNFTLIHDDLMDHDSLRRGRKAVHVLWGEATAINSGDALFALAFRLLAKVEVGHAVFLEILEDFSRMVQGIAEGQQLDMDFEKMKKVTEEEYLIMVEKKTALMFQYAAKGGALIGGGTRQQVEAMSEYGRLLGIGFQIWDDLLDIEADEEALGKPVGSDIKNGKRTLAAVWALENLDGANKEAFLKAYGNQNATKEDMAGAVEAMQKGGAIAYAKKQALAYAEKSKELLGVLSPSKEKDILLYVVDYMVNRET
ncbi:MAG: polyprenyl synthetase family protein [Thermoplasmata archaeon]|nr:polyprenyl synthetase family protein [Thermoplasmata archaeon]